MGTATFSFPSFRARVSDERVLSMQLLVDNPDAQRQLTAEVNVRSLLLTEAHATREPQAATRAASHLRLLANDLDALAHEWTVPAQTLEGET